MTGLRLVLLVEAQTVASFAVVSFVRHELTVVLMTFPLRIEHSQR